MFNWTSAASAKPTTYEMCIVAIDCRDTWGRIQHAVRTDVYWDGDTWMGDDRPLGLSTVVTHWMAYPEHPAVAAENAAKTADSAKPLTAKIGESL